MAIPAGYYLGASGFWYNASNEGPFSIGDNGAPEFLGITQIAPTYNGFFQGSVGYWYFTDGTGPFAARAGIMYRLF